MSAYSDYIISRNPLCYWRMNDVSGPTLVDLTGNRNGTYNGSQTFGVAGATGDGDTAVTFPGPTGNYAQSTADSRPSGLSQFTANVWFKSPDDDFTGIWTWNIDSGNSIRLRMGTSGRLYFTISNASSTHNEILNGFDWTAYNSVGFVFNNGVVTAYVNGVEEPTTQSGDPASATTPSGSGIHYVAAFNDATASEEFNGTIDDLCIFNTALSPEEMAFIGNGTPAGPVLDSLPVTLSGFLTSAASELPMRLSTMTQAPAASLPTRLESVAPGAFTGSVLSFTAQVILDGADLSASISGPISITHEEDASGLADFVIIPPAGPIDLNAYERKPVQISFVSNGIAIRRFTGVTASANYDPDSGLLTIDCTTDLQGQLEQMDRATIDKLIGGLWSEFVFDETADGWQYAQDQISTIQSEIHADVYGNLVVVPWAAKGTPDITLTDSERFSDSLTIERASLRDLLTKVRVNFDFRFTRLRHREMQVNWIAQRGLCDYLNNNWTLAAKDMVRTAAEGSEWTRTGEILYTEVPGADPSICNPPRAWAGGAEYFCLGASWQAARRWAQTITEEFAIDVVSPDIEEAIGPQQVNADYFVQNTFDSTDYEAQQDFTGPPAGFVYSSKSFDWQKDADDNPADGRAAMQAAQQVAMQAAKSEILGRARSNRVGVSHIYDPMMSLGWTVRINTPYLKSTGKVALIEETINPVTGDLGMAIEIAVSRHGGTGLGAGDPLNPPTAPDQPQEIDTGRIYTLGYHVGQEEFSPPDDPDWDGWMTNVLSNGDSYFPGGEAYDVRFVVAYPEVETEARDELTADEISTFNIVVPEDDLEISN